MIQLSLTYYYATNTFVRIFINKSFHEFDKYCLKLIYIDIVIEHSVAYTNSSELDTRFPQSWCCRNGIDSVFMFFILNKLHCFSVEEQHTVH